MRKKGKGRAQRVSRTRKRSVVSGAARKSRSGKKGTEEGLDSSSERFVTDLLIRGDAAERTPGGTLPSHATHEIVGKSESGMPKVKRRRFTVV